MCARELPRVMVVMGTRPEAIKLAPVVRALRESALFRTVVVAAGQHRELLSQVLEVFSLEPDYCLEAMVAGQSLGRLTGRLLASLEDVVAHERPEAVLVQGDTTTALAGALAAFYARIPVGHVEAGLRSGDRYAPFPEEINRRLISQLASWHFAPTEGSREALLREGVPAAGIVVTGNTGIDALYQTLELLGEPQERAPGRLVLVTAHRRESWGPPLEEVCLAVRDLLEAQPDVVVCFPVHPNPAVREVAHALLGGHPRARLLAPLPYPSLCRLLAASHLVITDSGGLQEEAPALGKPVLVLRDVTERPEIVELGVAELVGTRRERILASANRLLSDPAAYARMARVVTPYGDGRASQRILRFLAGRLVTPPSARYLSKEVTA